MASLPQSSTSGAAPFRLNAEEIRQRGMLLAKNKELLRLHRELVMSGMISEEEFWENRQASLKNQATLMGQRKGASSLLASDIRPTSSGSNDIKYVLTPSIIQSIFHQNPTVLSAYQDNVPEKMSEKEFWTEYFKSKHFQRGAASSSSSSSSASSSAPNILDKYFEEETTSSSKSLFVPEGTTVSKLVDISATVEDNLAEYHNGEGTKQSSRGEIALSLIRKFNKHSQSVLQSSGSSVGNPCNAKAELEKAVELEDLKIIPELNTLPLDIESQTKYFEKQSHGLSKLAAITESAITNVQNELFVDQFKNDLSAWKPNLASIDSQNMDYGALSRTLSHLQMLAMPDAREIDRVDFGVVTMEELILLHANAVEVLGHFWASVLSTNNPDRVAKSVRMHSIIKQLQEKLTTWCTTAPPGMCESLNHLCQPMQRTFDRANAKFSELATQTANKKQRTE